LASASGRRWTFGVVPPGGSTGLDCLIESDATPRLQGKVKFLRQTGDLIEEREAYLRS